MTFYPYVHLGYQSSVIFIFIKMAAPIPICANPLAAEANPRFQMHLMFQVAIKNVPLSPDQGDPIGADIVVNNLLIKLIINLITNGRISLGDYRVFTTHAVGQTHPSITRVGMM